MHARGRRRGGVSVALCVYSAREVRIEHGWLFEITIDTQEFTDTVCLFNTHVKILTKSEIKNKRYQNTLLKSLTSQ